MRLHNWPGAMLLLAAASTGFSSAIAAAPSDTSAQARFNDAEAAFERSDWPAAITGYRAALAAIKPGARSAAVIHARLAAALRYGGEAETAEREANAALRAFAAQHVTQDDDLAQTYILLGDMHRGAVQYPLAIADYQHAFAALESKPAPAAAAGPRIGLAYAALTENPDLAATTLDAMLGDTSAFTALPKAQQAQIYSLRGMADLNRGNAKAAAGYIDKALDLTGRTTTKVSLNQVRIRGDAALIYAKLGNQENVRQYLTYSGAGHLPDDSWLTAAEKDLPVCDDDVRPQDFAVVEFAIGNDGRTAGAGAVYASRPGPVGAAFATAVKDWQWQPAAVAKLDAFWRASVRLELRCVKRPPTISLVDRFRDDTRGWLGNAGYDQGLATGSFRPAMVGTAAIPVAFAALWKADGDRSVATAATALDRALIDAKAPVEVRAYALYLAARPGNTRTRRGWSAARAAKLAGAIRQLDQQPGTDLARAWLRTEMALELETSGALPAARAELSGVVALPVSVLAQDNPIRSIALLHLSLIDKRMGDPVAADKRLHDAGLDAEQCSLLDVRPVPRNTEISSSAFPGEALRWHFEGNVREAFDIAADGSVQDVRTVISYPPFVFGPATEKAVARFRYLPPTLDNQPLGCVGQTVNVNYRMPG